MNRADIVKRIKGFSARKETISITLIVVFAAAALAGMFISPQLYQWDMHEGDIALKDTYAPYDFTYSWGMDEESTNAARDMAVREVPFVLERDIPMEVRSREELLSFFDVLETEKAKDAPVEERVKILSDSVGGKVPEKEIRELLTYGDTSRLRVRSIEALDNVYLAGYISAAGREYLKEREVTSVVIHDPGSQTGITRTPMDLLGPEEARDVVDSSLMSSFDNDRRIVKAVTQLIEVYLGPNIKLDKKRTEKDIEQARREVKPVYHAWEVKKNEIIIEKGKRVNARHIAQMKQLKRIFRPGTTPAFFMGVVILFGLLWLVSWIYMASIRKLSFLRDVKSVTMLLLNMFFLLVVAGFIIRSPQPSYFIPMAGMAMLVATLIGFDVAFLSVIIMSLLIAVLVNGKIEVMLVLLVGSVVGMAAMKDVRRRAQILWAGVLVGVAKFLAIVCVGLINGMAPDFYIKDGIWGMASGLLSCLLVMGMLPLFEHVFKVCTNINLLELSDLNHPLLKRLAMEAPGTYHHSIMVGNLAESACDSIGANSLLARVGAYYHDIGKIAKAEYFNENEMGSGSRHSKLSPSMSALIIAKHVRDGVELAKKYKLNNAIIDFIRQHHGDSLIAFFYQKAMERSEGGTVLDEENFRYPGPRPQTKESAIILMADSVEASSRTLDEPTPSSIKNLVKKIINNKFIDGQLDECDLTLRDMHKIADSFVRVLMGIFHTRLEYPEDTERVSNGAGGNGVKNKHRKPKRQEGN